MAAAWRRVFLVAAMFGAILASGASPRPASVERDVRITVTAKNFSFTPSRIDVDKGDLVRITLVATDMPHSLSIDEYRIAKKASPGTDAVIEFYAQTSGTFTFYCSLTDDPRCRGMKGQLLVR